MIIKKPTRNWKGKATKCLDHIYNFQPRNMGEPEVVWTGLSDHALMKVKRFTKSQEKKPRYIRKRCYKIFHKEKFKKKMVREMTELDEVVNSECTKEAAEILTEG